MPAKLAFALIDTSGDEEVLPFEGANLALRCHDCSSPRRAFPAWKNCSQMLVMDWRRSGHCLCFLGVDKARDGTASGRDERASAQPTQPMAAIKTPADSSVWLVDLEHDGANRKERIARMVADGSPYSAEEDSAIQRQLAILPAADSAEAGKSQPQPSKTRRPNSVQLLKHGATVDSAWTKFDEERGRLLGYTQLVIRGASALDIIAYCMDADSRHMRSRADPAVDLRLDVKEERNSHYIVVFTEKGTAPFQNRTFLSALTWKKLSDTQYIWCSYPIAAHPSVTPSDEAHAVRGEGTRCFRLTFIEPSVTKVECVCDLELKGQVPTWVGNKIVIPSLLHMPRTAQLYFLQIRPIDECSTEDGTLLGHLLMEDARKAKKARRANAVVTFAWRTVMLREAPLANLDVLLTSMICKESYDGLAGDVKTQVPAQLTAADAETIGDGITAIRRGHTGTGPAKAVTEVLSKYPVLRATAQQCAWFEPMLLAMLVRQMGMLTVRTGDSSAHGRVRRALQSLTTCLRRAPSNADEGGSAAPDASVIPRGLPVIAASASEAASNKPGYAPQRSLNLQLPAR
jgi:hypothetical protein